MSNFDSILNSKNQVKVNQVLPYSVVIFTHSRPALVHETLTRFLQASESGQWNLIVVQQSGFPEVDEVIDSFLNQIDFYFRFDPISSHYLANINFSRLSGWRIAFETLQSELVLGIEEDTSLAKDALIFTKFVYEKYKMNSKFRGINLISYLPRSPELIHSYSVRRYGLSGQAGAISRQSWKKLSIDTLSKLGSDEEWASHIEPFMKTGFTIFSNQSRAQDKGWGGTSNPFGTAEDPYFERHMRSWVGEHSCDTEFTEINSSENVWREDAILYKPLHNLYFILREFQTLRFLYSILKRSGLPHIRNFIFRSSGSS